MKIFIPCLFFSCLVRFTPFCALGRSNRNQTVYVGEAIKLKCDALSNKTVQWSKDGAVLQSKTTGCGTSLLIGFVKYSEEGMYTCEVINKGISSAALDFKSSTNYTRSTLSIVLLCVYTVHLRHKFSLTDLVVLQIFSKKTPI